MSKAIRNRAIKSTLESAFGRGKVKVRGARGTAYGYVDVSIDWTPLDSVQSTTMLAHCKALLRAAGIDLGRAYTDDTCEFEMDMCHIGFNPSRYFHTMRHSDGTLSVLTSGYGAEWISQAEADSRAAIAESMSDLNYVGSRHHS